MRTTYLMVMSRVTGVDQVRVGVVSAAACGAGGVQ